MDKRGEFGWEEIAKILLALVFLLIIIALIYLYKDKTNSLLEGIKNLLRFG